MNATFLRRSAPLLALVVLIGLSACESPTASDAVIDINTIDTADLSQTLTSELALTTVQQQAVSAIMTTHEGRAHEPGLLWYVAADLQETLTDEQKERLLARTDSMRGNGHFGQGGPGGGGPGHGNRGPRDRGGNGGGLRDLLTDEQLEAAAAIRETYQPQFEALLEALRSESISREEFHTQMQALQEAMRAEIEALLTDEQREALEARRAEHEQAREEYRQQEQAAMEDALGLSADQITALANLMEQHQADREALREQFEAGDLTEEALHEALTALKAAQDEALQTLLDETQYEIVQIHDALAHRAKRRGGQGRRGPGGDRGGQGGPRGGSPFGG